MKNDFCVEEMMETQFPHLNQFIKEDYPTTTDAVDEWFKRCRVDHPQHNQAWDAGEYVDLVDAWFEKWFSQFKEKGD